MTAAEAVTRVARLRQRVTEHKRAIQQHRRQLQADATELAELEAYARRLGLGLYTQEGVGGTHGRD